MNLWFTPTEFSNAANMIKATSKNAMGVLLYQLISSGDIQKFGNLYLVDKNVVMYISTPSAEQLKKKTPQEFIMKKILDFMRRTSRKLLPSMALLRQQDWKFLKRPEM